MALIARELGVFLELAGAHDQWARWEKAKKKYADARDLGLELLVSLLDPSRMGALHAHLPANSVDEFKRFCRETANEEQLQELFALVHQPRNAWYVLKASQEIQKALSEAFELAITISLERMETDKWACDEKQAFVLVTGGPRFFRNYVGQATPLLTPRDYLTFLNETISGYGLEGASLPEKSVELNFLDRCLVQTGGTNEAGKPLSYSAYLLRVQQKVAAVDGDYLSTLYPEYPTGSFAEFQKYCREQASEASLHQLFQIANAKNNIWLTHKVNADIRTLVTSTFEKSELIAIARNVQNDLGAKSQIFAFLISGLHRFVDSESKRRRIESLRDLLEYVESLNSRGKFLPLNDFFWSHEAEIRFLLKELGIDEAFSKEDYRDYNRIKKKIRTLLVRQDPEYARSLLPQFPSDNLDNFRAFCKQSATEADFIQLLNACRDADDIWLGEKAAADIRHFVAQTMTSATQISKGQKHGRSENSAFCYLLGGLRLYKGPDSEVPLLEEGQIENFTDFLYLHREHFRHAERSGSLRELQFLHEAILVNSAQFHTHAPVDQPNFFEVYYNSLLAQSVDLAKQIKVSSTSAMQFSETFFAEGLLLTCGNVNFSPRPAVNNQAKTANEIPFEINLEATDSPGLPLIYFSNQTTKIRLQGTFKRTEKLAETPFEINGQKLKVVLHYTPIWLEPAEATINLGVAYDEKDLGKEFKLTIPLSKSGIDVKDLQLTGAYVKDTRIRSDKGDQISIDLKLATDNLALPEFQEPKATLNLQCLLGTSDSAVSITLIIEKDFPLVRVHEKGEGEFFCETDNKRPATFQIILNNGQVEKTVTKAEYLYRVPRQRPTKIRFTQGNKTLLEKTDIYAEYFKKRRGRRLRLAFIYAILLAGVVTILRIPQVFVYSLAQKNRLLTEVVLLANTGSKAEKLFDALLDKNADRLYLYEVIKTKRVYSAPLMDYLAAQMIATNMPAAEQEILLYTLQEVSLDILGSIDIVYSPMLRISAGMIWSKCLYGSNGYDCSWGEPVFANWASAKRFCEKLQIAKGGHAAATVRFRLPTVAEYENFLKQEPRILNSGLAQTDWLHWTSELLNRENKAHVVSSSEKSVFMGALSNEYTFRCIGTLK